MVVSGWAVPGVTGCSADSCFEQCFTREQGTNNGVRGIANPPLEKWSHLPEVTLNYESIVFANFNTFMKSLVVIVGVSASCSKLHLHIQEGSWGKDTVSTKELFTWTGELMFWMKYLMLKWLRMFNVYGSNVCKSSTYAATVVCVLT